MLQGLSTDETHLSEQKLVPATGLRPGAGGTGVSVLPTGAPGVFSPWPRGRSTVGPRARGWQARGSAGIQGWVAGGVPGVPVLPKPGRVSVCVCKLTIKWSSGLGTVKIRGSRVC